MSIKLNSKLYFAVSYFCDLGFYQLSLILNALLHVDLITLPISRHVPLSGHHDIALFEWHRQWHWIDTESDNYVIITSLKIDSTWKLIKRIPGSRLLISNLPGKASRTLVESRGKPRDSTSVFEALPGKLDIKWHSPSILYLPPLIASNKIPAKYGPRREKTCLGGFANNKDADQPAHPLCLISTFVIRLLESIISRLGMSQIPIF